MENQSLSALQEKIKTNDEAIAMFSEEVEVFKENDYLDVSIILLAFIVLVVDFGAVILVPTAIPSHVSLLFFLSALGTLAFSYIKLIKEHSDLVRLKFFKELVKGLPLSVILINPRNDSVVYANHKAHESLRYSPNTITLKYLLIGSLGIEFDNGTTSWLERLRNDGLHYKRGSYQMQRLDGTTFHAYSRSCYLSYKGSDYILFIFQNEDYRRKQERAIQQENTALQSYNNELTSRMQKVAHDIRAELATAAGVVDYFVHDETDKEKKEFLQMMEEAIKHLIRFTSDYLDIEKAREGGLVPINVTNFVLRIFAMMVIDSFKAIALRKNIQLDLVIDNDIPDVIATDKDHLKRALINLFDNSFKFTREGDKISLRISRMIEGNRISFSLTDTGQGMAPDDILNIWKPFVQGKGGKKQYRSTGLGLSIVKSTIERLGGSIAVESELGKGSTFIIVIPEKIESEE